MSFGIVLAVCGGLSLFLYGMKMMSDGLEKVAGTRYRETAASGEAMNEAENPQLIRSDIKNGYIEASNVQIADEMVNLIVAQRAYEMNSKAIQAADEMLGQANSLRR